MFFGVLAILALGSARPTFAQTPILCAADFGGVGGIGFEANGDIVATDSTKGRIRRIASGCGSDTVIVTGLNYPVGIVAEPSGGIIFGEFGAGSVRRRPPGGGPPVTYVAPARALGIARSANGDIYYAGGFTGEVKLRGIVGSNFVIASGLADPADVALEPSGDLIVTESTAGRVSRINLTTRTVTTVATGFDDPRGVAVDAGGNIFVAELGSGMIKRIAAGSNAVTTEANLGLGATRPYSLELAPNGDFYVGSLTGLYRLDYSAPAPVPTMSEWAMILFGTILAGGAALYIQRRRLTA